MLLSNPRQHALEPAVMVIIYVQLWDLCSTAVAQQVHNLVHKAHKPTYVMFQALFVVHLEELHFKQATSMQVSLPHKGVSLEKDGTLMRHQISAAHSLIKEPEETITTF